nr:radical SAM protein [uncultured Desulfobacter sp.]
MKVTLINTNNYKKPWPVMPLGLCMVASALEEAGHEIKFVDLCFSKDPISDLNNAFAQFIPDCVGIGIRNIDNCVGHDPVFLLDETKIMIDQVKALFHGPILLGGSAVSINTEEILDFFDLSYASCGDGEIVATEFVDRLQKGASLNDVRGLTIREGGRIVKQAEYVFDTDVDKLQIPMPHKYLNIEGYSQFDIPLQIQTKRGCLLRCNYCPNRYIEGRNYRLVNPQKIADHIELLVKETGIKRVEFVDSTFNIPMKHSKEVLRAIIDKKLDIGVNALGLHPAGIDEEYVNLMAEAGFETASLGIDAACDVTLKDMQKGFERSKILECVELLKKKNFPIAWYLLVGTEAESAETLYDTLDFVSTHAHLWDCIFIGVGMRVYNGSPLADRIMKAQPEATDDRFLKPIAARPETDLDTLKILTRHYAVGKHNIVIYNDENTPEFIHKMGFAFVKRFFPHMPVWRILITMRYLNKITGILAVQQFFYRLRYFKTFSRVDRQRLLNAYDNPV